MEKTPLETAIKSLGKTKKEFSKELKIARGTLDRYIERYTNHLPVNSFVEARFDEIMEKYQEKKEIETLIEQGSALKSEFHKETYERYEKYLADEKLFALDELSQGQFDSFKKVSKQIHTETNRDRLMHENYAADHIGDYQWLLDSILENNPSILNDAPTRMDLGVACSCCIETEAGYRVVISGYNYYESGVEYSSSSTPNTDCYTARFSVYVYVVTDRGIMFMQSEPVKDDKHYVDISLPKSAKYAYQVCVEWVEMPYP